jgi:hypothetical protein
MIIIWNHNEIAGRKCASVTVDHKRLHITERFGKIEGWIDGVKIGNYADLYEAKAAVQKFSASDAQSRGGLERLRVG